MREKLALEEPASELTLRSAEQDDLGQPHLRLAQKHRGVEVFGSQRQNWTQHFVSLVLHRSIQSQAFLWGTPALLPGLDKSGTHRERAALLQPEQSVWSNRFLRQ